MSETPDQATINKLVHSLRPKQAPKTAESNGHTETANPLSNSDVLENLFDKNYRLHGSGVDAPGFNLFARYSWRF